MGTSTHLWLAYSLSALGAVCPSPCVHFYTGPWDLIPSLLFRSQVTLGKLFNFSEATKKQHLTTISSALKSA